MLKIEFLKSDPDIPGANELTHAIGMGPSLLYILRYLSLSRAGTKAWFSSCGMEHDMICWTDLDARLCIAPPTTREISK